MSRTFQGGGWIDSHFSRPSSDGNWRRLRDFFTLQDKKVFPGQDDKLTLERDQGLAFFREVGL